MAFRALVFSKNPETNRALAEVCAGADIRVEICDDIFSAIPKATRQQFSCVLVDWADQPEAGFLLKRTRETASNINAMAIAIVDREPTPAEMRDHRLNSLIYRPIVIQEALETLTKALEHMPALDAGNAPEKVRRAPESAPIQSLVPTAPAEPHLDESPSFEPVPDNETMGSGPAHEANLEAPLEPRPSAVRWFSWRIAAASVLVLAAAFCLWNSRDTVTYLARTPENIVGVFKQSIAALFYLSPSSTTPVAAVATDSQQDAYFSRNTSSNTHPQLGVVSTEAEVNSTRLRPPSEFPLPIPVYEHPAPPPIQARATTIPDSLRGSAPMPPPVVVTVTPAQIMPVSTPVPPVPQQQFSEPVSLSEEAERALLIHSVPPIYPAEAASQKPRGPVVLQATISRDGNVEDLKIVRGSFILSKAAIAAVKQWRFQPYMLNGHAVETQTFITVNFNAPAN